MTMVNSGLKGLNTYSFTFPDVKYIINPYAAEVVIHILIHLKLELQSDFPASKDAKYFQAEV